MVVTSTGVIIDDATRTVKFNPYRPKKISGSRIASILGEDRFNSEFKTACEIAKINPPIIETPRMRAGDHSEPLVRDYLRKNVGILERMFNSRNIGVEDPIPKESCYYEHFPNKEPFGGLVDGYITSNGRRIAVLEIKTVKSNRYWFDSSGNEITPTNYHLQASLYCALSGLNKILFVIAELPDNYLLNISTWVPTNGNLSIRVSDPLPMTRRMNFAKDWYEKYILKGTTPPWTDEDIPYVEQLRTIHSINSGGHTVAVQDNSITSPISAPVYDGTLFIDVLSRIKQECGKEVMKNPVMLKGALNDCHVEKKDVFLITMVVEGYSDELSKIAGSNDDIQIRRLSSRIASERYLDESFVYSFLKDLLSVMD